MQQTSASESSYKIEWNSVAGANRYVVLRDDSPNGKYDTVSEVSNPSFYDSGRSAGAKYYVKVQAVYKEYVNGAYRYTSVGKESAPIEVVTKTSSSLKPTISQSKSGNTTTAIKVNWAAVSGANRYRIEYYKYGEGSSTAKSVYSSTTSATLTGLSKNSKYYVHVYPQNVSSAGYVAEGYYAYSDPYGVIPSKIGGVKLETFYPSIETADITWNKSESATGYQYQVYSYNGKTKVISKTTTSSSVSLSKKLRINKFYRVRVRGYVTIDGSKQYGDWSSWKYVSGGSKKVKLTKKTGKLSMSWSKVSGATSYTVYVSTKKPSSGSVSGMTKVKTTSKTSYKISKFKGKKISKKKKYYVVVVANRKVGKTTYKSTPYYYYYK